MAFDIETENGRPYFLTLYDGKEVKFFKVNERTIIRIFLSYLEKRCPKNRTNVMFAHNLQFDLTALLSKNEFEIFRYRQPPLIAHPKGTMQVYSQKIWFAKVCMTKNNARVKILDSANFVHGQLYHISRDLGFKTPKPKRPYFVEAGRAPKNREELYRLHGYCRAEIKAEYELGQFILDMHQQYNCGIAISASQLSSKVFRKHFLDDSIPQAPDYVRNKPLTRGPPNHPMTYPINP